MCLLFLNPIHTADATQLSSWVALAVCTQFATTVAGDSFDEPELICQQWVELCRVGRASSRRQSSCASCELCSHRGRRRDSTRQLRRVGVGGVYWALPFHQCCDFDTQDDEESYGRHSDDAGAQSDAVQEAIRNDELRRLERSERSAAESAILLAAKIISSRIGANYEDGYDWCIEQVRLSRDRGVGLYSLRF